MIELPSEVLADREAKLSVRRYRERFAGAGMADRPCRRVFDFKLAEAPDENRVVLDETFTEYRFETEHEVLSDSWSDHSPARHERMEIGRICSSPHDDPAHDLVLGDPYTRYVVE
jgi:hypothetical protein